MNIPYTTQQRWDKQGYCPWPLRKQTGRSKDPAYKCWENMIQRCTNPKASKYYNYGGRGIKVHPEFLIFSKFIAHIGPRPSKNHSIDRIDVNGDYAPGNVKWSTINEQNSNKRLDSRIEKHGKKYRFDFNRQRYVFNSLEEATKIKNKLHAERNSK